MPISLRRPVTPSSAFVAGGSSDFRLPKGMAHSMAYLSLTGTATPTGTGLAVRPRGLPIRSIQLITDQGITPHVIVGSDALVEAELYEQTPLGTMYSPPAGAVSGTGYAFSANLPLFFSEPRAGSDAWNYTSLPSWAFTGDVILRVYWGDCGDMYSGTVSASAFANVVASLMLVSLDRLDAAAAQAPDFTSRFWQTYKSSNQAAAAAGGRVTLDLPRTEDTRSILVVTLDANGNYADGIVDTITLEENNTLQRVSGIPASILKGDAARFFGVTPPPGVYLIEFAEDEDITSINPSSGLDQFQLRCGALATGTVRVYSRRLGGRKR